MGGGSGALNFSGTQTLGVSPGKTGTVLFEGAGGLFQTTSLNISGSGGKLTVAPGITIHGSNGNINVGSNTLDIQGTLSADLAPNSVLSLSVNSSTGGSWSNEGTLEATNGANLNLNGSWTNASTGQIIVNASTISFSGSWINHGSLKSRSASVVILGGAFGLSTLGNFQRDAAGKDSFTIYGTLDLAGQTLESTAGPGPWGIHGTIANGTIAVDLETRQPGGGPATSTLQDVTLSGKLLFQGNDTINVAGAGLTLSGGTVDLGGGSGALNFSGTQTLGVSPGKTGTVLFEGAGGLFQTTSLNISGSGGKLTVAPGVTIHGSNGNINVGANTLDIQGTLSADLAPNPLLSLSINSSTGGSWSNTGLIEATNGANLNLNGSWTNSNPTTISLNNGSTLNLSGTWTDAAPFSLSGGAASTSAARGPTRSRSPPAAARP